MLINGSSLNNFPVLSLHVGAPIARTKRAVIDPDNLKIIAFHVDGPLVGRECGEILDVKDVREFAPRVGMIIDSADDLVNPGDVVKFDKVMKLNFNLTGLKVETKKGTKLGKIVDYTVNSDTFTVQQLVVQRPIMKAFLDPELIIGRSEIVEITDYKVIVKDEEAKIKQKTAAAKDFVPNFVNPFREPDFAPAHTQSHGEQDTE